MWIKLCQQKIALKFSIQKDLNKQESSIPIFLATILAILQFNQHFAFGKAFVTDSPPRAIHLVFFGLQGIAFHIFRQNQSFFCLFFTVWTQKPFDGVRPFSPSWQDQKPLLQCGYETSGKNTIFSVLILYPFIVLPFVIITTTQKMEYY